MDKVRQYAPNAPAYAERIPDDRWEEMRPVLDGFHRDGWSRTRMLGRLAKDYDFHPSRNQLNARMASWGCKAHRGTKAASGDQAPVVTAQDLASTIRTDLKAGETGQCDIASVCRDELAAWSYDASIHIAKFDMNILCATERAMNSAKDYWWSDDLASCSADIPGGVRQPNLADPHLTAAITDKMIYTTHKTSQRDVFGDLPVAFQLKNSLSTALDINLTSEDLMHEDLFSDLLAWCEQTIDSVELNPELNLLTCDCDILSYCEVKLIEYYVRNWIQNARRSSKSCDVDVSLGAPRLLDLAVQADALKMISRLAVQRIKKFIQACVVPATMKGLAIDVRGDVVRVLKIAMYELRSDIHQVFCQFLQAEMETPMTPENLLSVMSFEETHYTLSEEDIHLRHDPETRSHTGAHDRLEQMHSNDKDNLGSGLRDLDFAMYDFQSTSSLRSFRRAGIKLKDMYGPPTMSDSSFWDLKSSRSSSSRMQIDDPRTLSDQFDSMSVSS